MEINSPKKGRAFLALPVNPKYYSVIKDLQFDLIADLEYLPHSVNWTKNSRLHITLFFLGEQSHQSLQLLIAEINKMHRLSTHEIISFQATQIQLFPTPKPTVIALTGDCPPALKRLRNNISHSLEKTRIYPDLSHETHGFLPHITLGKLKEATDLKNQPFEISVDFTEFTLFKSEQTTPYLVTHTPLRTWRLNQSE